MIQEEQPKQGPKTGIQPWYTLVFVASVITVLGLISLVYPKSGIKLPMLSIAGDTVIPPFTLHFPRFEDFLTPDTTKAEDIEDILAGLQGDAEPSKSVLDTSGQFRKSAGLVANPKAIQYPNNDPSVLFPAFEALEQAMNGSKPTRVMHYGDSQIEGDRMTSLFRARLQEKFGGGGPGLVSAKPLTSSMSVTVEYSENMQRFAQYGVQDKSVKHRRYGAMAVFSRFAPVGVDSTFAEGGEMHTGWVSLSVSRAAFGTTKNYSSLRMYYGFNRSDVNVKVFLDDVLFADDNLPANKSLRVKQWRFDKPPGKIMIIMEGYDSPDIYGLSLDAANGVSVDNISMRGSSGTTFGSLETNPFKPMLDSLNVKLLFMQYGGNTVPYIKDKDAAYGYARSFKTQIELMKRLCPGAAIIVIGPSDMGTKIDGKMQSYPNLVFVRDALKQVSFEAGAAFFDIYEAMGGQNSMIEWVGADPPLAATDYVHFSPQGARIIAEAFIKSLLADYEAYHLAKVN